MKPAPFEYRRPGSVEEALDQLAAYGADAKPLAGGQSLVPAMNFRLAQPAVLIDLNGVPELAYLRADGGDGLRIGAMTRQRAVERSALAAQAAPLVHEAMPYIAHPQIRNRGTVGGSIAHADPAAELPAVMLALGARFEVRNRSDARWIPAEQFFTGLFATVLEPGDLLAEIAVPAQPPRSGCAFEEVARRHGDYALVGVAAVVVLDGHRRCRDARVVLLSVGDGPVLAASIAQQLAGEELTPDAIRDAAEAAATRDIDPPSDIHASAPYRRHLAAVLMRRALTRAADPARTAATRVPT